MGLSSAAEAGPVFYAINKCVHELDLIATAEMIESDRGRVIDGMEISIRLAHALRAREILTVRELEAKSAEELVKLNGFGKKMLREVRELLASLNMKLKGDP
jgi:DNA-directed RNA polymerase alpha subunit